MSASIRAADPILTRLASADSALVRAKAGLAEKAAGVKGAGDIDAAAKDFESMFLQEMLSHMFETTPVDSEFGGGQAEETWRGMMVEQYSRKMVEAGGIGLSPAIKAQMIAMQEKADR